MKKAFKKAGRFITEHRAGIALTLIIILAVFFRFWRLYDLPPGLHPDEAANGLDIFRIQDGDLRVLYNTNGPREALFFYLQAVFVGLFGNTILALRIAPALIGVGSVLAIYALAKDWFGRRAGLLAGLLAATGVWAVTMSRNGYRASMMILMIPLTLWLFSKAIKSGKWFWYVAAGASFGLGFYTYLAYKFSIVIVGILFIYVLIFYRKQFVKYLKPLLLSALAALIVLVPFGMYAVKHPDEAILGRSSVSFTNPELNDGKPIQTLLKTTFETALMFNIKGDPNYRHNLGGAPMLNAFVGIMFLLGLLVSLRRFKDIRYFTLLVIFAIMLIPELLTAEGIPHGLRAIGVVPIVYILAAIGITELLERWRTVFPRNPAAITTALGIVAMLLVLSTYYDYKRYFVAWANSPNTYAAYSEDSVALAQYMNEHPYSGTRYGVVDSYSNISVQYLTHDKSQYKHIEGSGLEEAKIEGPTQFVVLANQQAAADPALAKFNAQLIATGVSDNRNGLVLYRVYEVNSQQ